MAVSSVVPLCPHPTMKTGRMALTVEMAASVGRGAAPAALSDAGWRGEVSLKTGRSPCCDAGGVISGKQSSIAPDPELHPGGGAEDPMKHLFLHVGMYKTGSTSIQATFFANRDRLAGEGLHYLDHAQAHSRLVARAFNGAASGTPGREAQTARQVISDFIARVDSGRLIISGEGIARMLPADVRPLLVFLRERVDRLTVVCFVRPPVGYISSNTQQRIRGGLSMAALRRVSAPSYRSHIKKFQDCADLAELVLQLWDRKVLQRGCSIATMLAICGARPTLYDELALHQENGSMTRAGAALLLALNEAGLPVRRDAEARGADRTARRHAVRLANALPGPRFEVPPALVAAALELPEVQADLDWIEAQLGAPFADRAAALARRDEPALARAAAWPEAELASLERAEVSALADLLRQDIAERPRASVPGAIRLERALGWLEGWLAGAAGATTLPAPALAEFAGLLVASLRGLDWASGAESMSDKDAA
jgi:hypothetical protein